MSGDISYDISGTKKLYAYIGNFEEKYDEFLIKLLKSAGIEAQRITIDNTNVGRHGQIYGITGGNLRRAWKLTPVTKSGNDYKITLYADSQMAEYAYYVEEGHITLAYSPKTGKRIFFQTEDGKWHAAKNGWVEGQHMARNAVDDVAKDFEKLHDAAFKRFIASLGS